MKVKPKFKRAIVQLSKMSKKRQRHVVHKASNAFIKDLSTAVRKLRNKGHLVSNKHKRVLQRHKHKLRVLANASMPVYKRRAVLNQKGGFVFSTVLIPIIAAAIGAAGTVAGSAAGAAVMKG